VSATERKRPGETTSERSLGGNHRLTAQSTLLAQFQDGYLHPSLRAPERTAALVEGWILGCSGSSMAAMPKGGVDVTRSRIQRETEPICPNQCSAIRPTRKASYASAILAYPALKKTGVGVEDLQSFCSNFAVILH